MEKVSRHHTSESEAGAEGQLLEVGVHWSYLRALDAGQK
jgi:hypothetical protein